MIAAHAAVVAIDLHRRHRGPAIATPPLPAAQSAARPERTVPAFKALRHAGIPIAHVITESRDAASIRSFDERALPGLSLGPSR
ncbi:MAG TPA: hypothetical protein VKB51_11745 [bacterium]|nr:hypothetical protein [bacterium]